MTGRRTALLIAATEYNDDDLTGLNWPAADVDSLAEVLGDDSIGGFDIHDPVVNQPSHVVRRKIDDFLSDAGPEDFKLLYFSCHGVLSDNRRLFFAMPDTETRSIRSTAVEDYFVHSALQQSRAPAKVLILDCCHSGAFAHGLTQKGSREREIDVERLTGAGLVTLSASKEIEYAYEEGHFTELEGATGGSIFTRIMVEGLRTGEADLNHDGVISVDELYEWTSERMRAVTTRQQPGHSAFRQHGRLPIGWTRRSLLPDEVRARLEDETSVHGKLWAIDRLRVLRTDAERELAAEIHEALLTAVEDADTQVAASAEAALAGRPAPSIGVTTRDAPPPPSIKAASLIRQADEHRAARRFRQAFDKYDEALALSPEATDGQVGRAHALLGLRRADEALDALDAAVEADPTHIWARVSRADLLLTLDRPAAAQLDIERALEAEYDSAEVLAMHGRVLTALGQTKKAIAAYESALQEDPDSLSALVGLAGAQADSRATKKALATVGRALEIDDASVDARLVKARLHYAADKPGLGDAEVAKVLQIDPTSVQAVLLRGLAHLWRERRSSRDPIKDFDLALEYYPDLPGALFGRAVLLKDTKPADALHAIERIDPGHRSPGLWQPARAAVCELEAEILLGLDDAERALAAADSGLAEAPSSTALRVLRVRANLAVGRPEQAFEDLGAIAATGDPAVEALRTSAMGSLMGRPREVWPAGVTEDDVAQALHGDTLLAAPLPGPPVDPMVLVRALGPDEELVWYTACRYRNESFRRVALLLTSRQLVWAGRDEGHVAWRDVRDVRVIPPKGMRLVLHSGRRLEFPGVADEGIGFSDKHTAYDSAGVRELVASLVQDHA